VNVTFQLTLRDYYQGLLAWRTLLAWRRWLLRCSYLLMGLTIPVAVLLAYTGRDSGTLRISAGLLAFAALWFTYMLAGPWFSARQQFRGSPSAQSPITIEASDDGLAVHSAHGDSKVAWSAYMAWTEAKSVFVILPQPRIYVPIPKRAFTDEQLGEFREILRRNVGKK
jgi:hypothetical protein